MDCPECGSPTQGTFSEGGTRWALCEECFARAFPPIENRGLFEDPLEADPGGPDWEEMRRAWHTLIRNKGK